MIRSMEARLARLERERTPALPLRALVIHGETDADAQRQIADAITAGRHVDGWPVITFIYSGANADDPWF